MNKRYIGLDIGIRRTLMVVLIYAKDELVAVHCRESHQDTQEEQLSELRSSIEGDFHASDKVVTVLPACRAFVRDLEFPFKGARKIASALPMALNIQIPIPVEACTTAFYFSAHDGKTVARVKAAAVHSEALSALLDVAEQSKFPLHIVDLAPFAFVAGLAPQLSDGLLVFCGDQETTVSLIQGGVLVDYRLIPVGTDLLDEDKAVVVERELRALLINVGVRSGLPIYLAGEAGSEVLIDLLVARDFDVQELALKLSDHEIPPVFAPAASLALRAAVSGKRVNSFNFRHGEFGPKGEWQKFRKPLLCSAGLLLLLVLLLVATGVTLIQAKTGQVDLLQNRIVDVYRETFPEATVITDAPKQLEVALRELQEQSALLGGAQVGVLLLLKTVSDLPDELNVELQELSYTVDEARISGSAESFEQVNQLTDHLAASPLFDEVRVADAKMSIQGDEIDFRLLLVFSGVGGAL
jgi:general secretion pathway protein L